MPPRLHSSPLAVNTAGIDAQSPLADSPVIAPAPNAPDASDAPGARPDPGTSIRRENFIRNMLIDMLPFRRTVSREQPAYQAPADSWADAAADLSENFFEEIRHPINILALAEAISCMELARAIKDKTPLAESPLRQAFPEVHTMRQAHVAAIDAYLVALNQKNSNGEIQDSWASAGMGYPHRKDQLALSGILGVLNAGQALCPEPTTKIALNVVRGVLSLAWFAQGLAVGKERVYYKLTDELVSLGLPVGTPGFKNAPYALAAAWQLPSVSRLRNAKVQFKQAIEAFDALAPDCENAARAAAIAQLRSAQDNYRPLRDRVDGYKAVSYASQIEWAGYRQRATNAGASLGFATGTGIGVGLAAGPLGAIAGAAIGFSVALPTWAGAHLLYHAKGWKAPDNRDKIENALLSVIKSPDLYDQTKTSGPDIAARYAAYKNNAARTDAGGGDSDRSMAALTAALAPQLNLDVVDKSWGRPVGMRLKLGERILCGKFILAAHDAQTLQSAAQPGVTDPENESLLLEKKSALKKCWSDLANFEIFSQSAALFKNDPARHDLCEAATTAMSNITDIEFRNIMNRNLETQMDAGETAKKLTKGEVDKYQLTYFIGSLLGDATSLGLTLTSAMQSSMQAEAKIHAPDHVPPAQMETYKLGSFGTLLFAPNVAEVSAGRVRFARDTARLCDAVQDPAAAAALDQQPASGAALDAGQAFFTPDDVSDQVIGQLLDMSGKTSSVALFSAAQDDAQRAPHAVDLSSAAPYWDEKQAGGSMRQKLRHAKAVTVLGAKHLGVSATGLGHRLVASGTTMRWSRHTRRELVALNDAARQRLAGLPERMDDRAMPSPGSRPDAVSEAGTLDPRTPSRMLAPPVEEGQEDR